MKTKTNGLAILGLAALCAAMLVTCGDIPMKATILDAAIDYEWVPVSPTPYFKAPTPASGEMFGWAVDISDDFAIIGTNNNRAYVFRIQGGTWSYMTTLTGTGGVNFGYSVAISGNFIVVGDPGYDGGRGDAFLFEYNGISWNLNKRLNCPTSATAEAAGFSVAVDGDYIAVGAPYRSANAGSVYCFYRDFGTPNSWGNQPTINSPAPSAEFGTAVAVSGTYLSIGASAEDEITANSGAFYLSARSGTTWSMALIKTKAPSPISGVGFGISIDVSGVNVVVGERGTDKAYFYSVGGSACTFLGNLLASDTTPGDEFGYSTSLFGSYALIGAHWHDAVDTNSGSAYVFKINEWDQEKEIITKAIPEASDELGYSCAISRNYLVVGIPNDNEIQNTSGKIVIYRKTQL